MRAIIVEDEYYTARTLQGLLQKLEPDIEVLQVLQSVEECVEWFGANSEPDLAFMDIHLADTDVFTLFDRVSVTCPIIFTTAYEEYALKAFEVYSIDYILKPIVESDLKRALDKAKRAMGSTQEDRSSMLEDMIKALKETQEEYKSHLLIPYRDKLLPLSVDKIIYIRAENKGAVIVTADGKENFIDYTLDRFAKQLSPHRFFRANRQYLVAHDAVESVSIWFGGKLTLNLIMPTPDKVVVSKAKNKEFKEWFQRAQKK